MDPIFLPALALYRDHFHDKECVLSQLEQSASETDHHVVDMAAAVMELRKGPLFDELEYFLHEKPTTEWTTQQLGQIFSNTVEEIMTNGSYGKPALKSMNAWSNRLMFHPDSCFLT